MNFRTEDRSRDVKVPRVPSEQRVDHLNGLLSKPTLMCCLFPATTSEMCHAISPGIHLGHRPSWVLPDCPRCLQSWYLSGLFRSHLNKCTPECILACFSFSPPLHYLKQYPKLEHGTRAETLSRSISLDASRRQHQLPAELLWNAVARTLQPLACAQSRRNRLVCDMFLASTLFSPWCSLFAPLWRDGKSSFPPKALPIWLLQPASRVLQRPSETSPRRGLLRLLLRLIHVFTPIHRR